MANYRKLTVWQKADELAFRVYQLTKMFPKDEVFGLTSQLRRAALSIPTNIVEGYNRKSKKELKHYLDISLGSLAETEYLVGFANRLGYLVKSDFQQVAELVNEVGKLLWSFQRSL